MDKKLLMAFIDSLVSEAVSKIELPEGQAGPRGIRGKDGNDFNLEDHKEVLLSLIQENIPKEIPLTAEQKEELRGPAGRDGIDGAAGKDGRNGRDGRDFLFEEHKSDIESILRDCAPKFEDFTPEQIEMLRGPRGNDGKDFSFEDNKEAVDELIINYLEKVKDVLKLKFEDLTDEQKEELRGPRGQRGKAGKDFDLEEAKPVIEDAVHQSVFSLAPDLKLKFTDLTDEEKEGLKLKFSQLTDEERFSLRGPRGQRGKQGIQGEKGDAGVRGERGLDGATGPMGPRGVPGLTGLTGPKGKDGKDGEDGKDAPKISDVQLEVFKDNLSFICEFDNGEEIETNKVRLPRKDTVHYYPIGMVSSSGGSSNLDGGIPNSIYGGITPVDGGGV